MSRHLLRKALRLPQAALKRLVTGLLQLVLLANRPARLARSGFVLPTTVLLVLMVVLTATALTYRSFTRSDMAISQREQQVITNAATPAIDRAKAKLEFLFQTDNRFPSGVPNSDILADLMLVRDGFDGHTTRVSRLAGRPDPYTLPGETRVDINNDNILDNAWMFNTDVNGDGRADANEIVVYSILVDDEATPTSPTATSGENLRRIDDPVDRTKANALVTRTGPLATTEASPACAGALAEGGWQVVQQGNNSTLQKNFQVNAFVANLNDANRTFQTLEFQQSRSAARANKWGAWFRYDLEVSPFPEFNWNGAMHTDGSFMTWAPGGTGNERGLRSHMISSQNSCLYSQEASEISLGEFDPSVNGDVAFQGQAINGNVSRNKNTDNDNNASLIHVWTSRIAAPTLDIKLGPTTDSISGTNVAISDVAMNPLTLFTRDVAEHFNAGSWTRDSEWQNRPLNTQARIINDEVARPFVDDFFRADNRWGPKPRYDSRDSSLDMENVAGASSGTPINNLGRLTEAGGGLDGYWERQSIDSGLRLIVGQRLELGNAFGWNANPFGGTDPANNSPTHWYNADRTAGDALYPAKIWPRTERNGNANIDARYGRTHEYLQRRSLRDNLAAVQGMTVYHYRINNGQFPAACMAMTAHPGTRQTIVDSRTFEYYPDTTIVKADFFNGKGTNGWEFQFPGTFNTPGGFANQVVVAAPLGRALRNLAYFAGDPRGGAPSFPPVQDTFVHPYPYMSMWGDFSPLRRIIDRGGLNTAADFNALSPADQATVHSAACTLSMLAQNVKQEDAIVTAALNAINDVAFDNLTNTATQLGNEFRDLIRFVEKLTGGPNNYNNRWPATRNPLTVPGLRGCTNSGTAAFSCNAAEYLADFDTEEMLDVFKASLPPGQVAAAADEINKLRLAANAYKRISSITRDRELGFRPGLPSLKYLIAGYTPVVTWDQATGLNSQVSFSELNNRVLKTACDPNIFAQTPSTVSQQAGGFRVALALIVCNEIEEYPIRYPSLFYLFPMENHGQTGTAGSYNEQPAGEEFFTENVTAANRYILGSHPNGNVNGGVTYGIIGTGTAGLTWPDAIAATPQSINPNDWRVPADSATGTITPDDDDISDQNAAFKIIAPGGGVLRVPFLDKGVYNGREQLNTRVLDIDIQALANSTTSGGDYWLSADQDRSAEGVVYAFREDATREDEIVRPAVETLGNCNGTVAQTIDSVSVQRLQLETVTNCRMFVEPGNATRRDPPLGARNISLKPIDYYADPERRPHGFRLRTFDGSAADFSGPVVNGRRARAVGMTFVTDNSVYIQGDFNTHSTDGSATPANLLEEFTQRLNGTPPVAFGLPFYDGRTTLNTQTFATLANDRWRPVEILADAITLLSGNFKDGAVEDTFTQARPGTIGDATSSYMNQNRPNVEANQTNWLRENGERIGANANGVPVWVDRNGTYYRTNAPHDDFPNRTIRPFYDVYNDDPSMTHFGTNVDVRRQNLQRATPTVINATFISGLVPQRPQQGYGGLHNFVRMLEDWNDTVPLQIAGSFIQLNFSTSSTGPFEHDLWQAFSSTITPGTGDQLGYYLPPLRRWGYDVALLYLPPAPAARRFVNIGTPRSEYYRELPSDDPYIVNLRCARNGGAPVMPGFCPA